MNHKKTLLALLLILTLVFTGCRVEPKPTKLDYDKPLAPGQPALRKLTNPYEIPDFTLACIDLKNLRQAINHSLEYLNKPSSQQYFPVGDITHFRVVKSLETFAQLIDSGLTGSALNQAIRERFDVYMSVGCDDKGTVLFTGYYTPIFEGSIEPTDRFRYPLYKTPADLEKDPTGRILGRRLPDGTLTRYPPRAVIERSKMFAGNELVYLADPFEVYIAHVQGSAKIRTPDGQIFTVGYAASNGYEYKSISKQMIHDGVITEKQLSLASMIDYFKNHPEQVEKYTHLNPRFVFFQQHQGPPHGSLNTPVTAYRTIATDKSIFPRACLAFITTNLPQNENGYIVNRPYSAFVLDQDTGGAIRAPGRCDIYMGIGNEAGKLAGQVYQEGRLYYLVLKPHVEITHY